ncbi:MAG TPA: hypothetical protein VGK67_22790 [Myxococcales bacterium]
MVRAQGGLSDPRGEFIAVPCELARLGGREATGTRAEELRARFGSA